MGNINIGRATNYSQTLKLEFLSMYFNDGLSVSTIIKKLGKPSRRIGFYWIKSYKLGNLAKIQGVIIKKKSKKNEPNVLKPSHGFESIQEEVIYLRQSQIIHAELLVLLKKKQKIIYP